MRFLIIIGSVALAAGISYASFTVKEHPSQDGDIVIIETFDNGDKSERVRSRQDELQNWKEARARAQENIDKWVTVRDVADVWIEQIQNLE